MGNHYVGKVFAANFEFLGNRCIDLMSREDLLSLFDSVGNEFKGVDAEFDNYCNPAYKHPLSKALIKAFAPEMQDIDFNLNDIWEEGWYEKVYQVFRDRYDFK